VAEVGSINAGEWYEFETNAIAYNDTNDIFISFTGSEPENLDFEVLDYDEKTNPFGTVVYSSKTFPGKQVIFDIQGVDDDGMEHRFYASGMTTGIFFNHRGEPSIVGKTVKKIRIKANLDHDNIVIKWFSTIQK